MSSYVVDWFRCSIVIQLHTFYIFLLILYGIKRRVIIFYDIISSVRIIKREDILIIELKSRPFITTVPHEVLICKESAAVVAKCAITTALGAAWAD